MPASFPWYREKGQDTCIIIKWCRYLHYIKLFLHISFTVVLLQVCDVSHVYSFKSQSFKIMFMRTTVNTSWLVLVSWLNQSCCLIQNYSWLNNPCLKSYAMYTDQRTYWQMLVYCFDTIWSWNTSVCWNVLCWEKCNVIVEVIPFKKGFMIPSMGKTNSLLSAQCQWVITF